MLREIEDGIISKSSGSCWLKGDDALAYAFSLVNLTAACDDDHHAAEAS
jgi:hypothetical protein